MLVMQKEKPEKLYRELLKQGLIPEEAMHQLQRDGYSLKETLRAVAIDTKRRLAQSFDAHLAAISDPTLTPRSYETVRKFISSIVSKKAPRGTTTLSAKRDFVLKSLDKSSISIPEGEIELLLNENADDRATDRAVLGIFLALAIDHFRYDPKKQYQPAIMNIKKVVSCNKPHRRTEDTIRDHLKNAARLFALTQTQKPNSVF